MGVVAVAGLLDELLGVAVLAQLADHFPRLVGRELGHHDVTHHRRGGLIAHADAGRPLDGELPVGGSLAHLHAEFIGECFGHGVGALHLVDDVVGEPDRDLTGGLGGEEGVERHRALHLYPGNPYGFGDRIHRLARHVAELALNGPEDFHQPRRVVSGFAADLLDRLKISLCVHSCSFGKQSYDRTAGARKGAGRWVFRDENLGVSSNGPPSSDA